MQISFGNDYISRSVSLGSAPTLQKNSSPYALERMSTVDSVQFYGQRSRQVNFGAKFIIDPEANTQQVVAADRALRPYGLGIERDHDSAVIYAPRDKDEAVSAILSQFNIQATRDN